LPPLAQPFEPGNLTYVSSLAGAEALARLSGPDEPRKVMVFVETGDEREGVPPELLPDMASAIAADPRLELEGVATNYACFRGDSTGVRGSVETVAQAAATLRAVGLLVPRVSGGNSSLLWMLKCGQSLPREITELRCGEALLLGQDALFYEPVPGCRTDACLLRAEVLEEYTRPTSDGPVRRLVLGIGSQDLASGGIRFARPGLKEVGRTADYLIAEATPDCEEVGMGRTLEMIPAYEALVAAWTSPFVDLKILG
jgi:predicted amino acid racemase